MQSILFAAVILSHVVLMVCDHDHSHEKCLPGPYHKPYPGPEGPEYADCHSWKQNTCCFSNITQDLKVNRSENLYPGWRWDHCENLTTDCEKYLKNQECFYQCEPALIRFQDPNYEAGIKAVPICASYCDKWFNACKNDKTCEPNWYSGFNKINGEYRCPVNNTCQTYGEAYTNGEGICRKMWGPSFTYEKSNTNCMVMEFDSQDNNPNGKVYPTASDAVSYRVAVPRAFTFCFLFAVYGPRYIVY